MRFDVLTIFPSLLDSPLDEGILRRARQQGQIEVAITNIRDFASDRQSMTDDRPFGGGAGMVMKPEPLAAAVQAVRQAEGSRVVLLSPQGSSFNQAKAEELSSLSQLVLVCGRYEGLDQRFVDHYVDEEISIGDFILTGGELPAMLIIDAVTRLLPGVLGCAESVSDDSFSRGGLKYPQYTRPREFEGEEVPEVLLSGDHGRIERWRWLAAMAQTRRKRPDLFARLEFSPDEQELLRENGIL
ncbi:MAG: tRNA (guanosine(37)-N1)-methyltransferase TrmD [Thermodesulfobacteriota bacterium]